MKGRMDAETPVQKFHLQLQHRSFIVHFVQANISRSFQFLSSCRKIGSIIEDKRYRTMSAIRKEESQKVPGMWAIP